MNKKRIIILIVIIVLILVAVGWLIYSQKAKQPGTDTGFFSFLFPSAEEREMSGLPESPDEKDLSSSGISDKITKIGNLTQLSSVAISGAGLASSTVRYVEKPTGHIYEINPNGQGRQRLSNTTILKTFDGFGLTRSTK